MTRNEYIEANLTLNLLNQIIDAHGKLVSLSQQQTDNKFALTLRFSDGTTGYTAYALAAGGPIIEPNLPVSLVVPICPHTLTQRPVVIDARSPITITPGAKTGGAQLSIDGQQQHRLHHKDRITIRAGIPLPVLHPENYHFQDRLRAKLNWGIAPEDSHG